MARLNATITNQQLAGWQWATDQHNARETERKAALTPPEVHVQITADDYASLLNGITADDYVRQAKEADEGDLLAKYREGNQAKRQAIKDAAK